MKLSLLLAITAVATTNAISHRFSGRVTERATNAYRFVEKKSASTNSISEGNNSEGNNSEGNNSEGGDEKFTPKIEPGGDAPVMHTSDWIHGMSSTRGCAFRFTPL